ncbi:ABC transporter substrate-binding protein [Sphingomonas sp. 3-13AW]|uniref:ABC transporter substrate-binding protein n=1 Tax=Sphingomonas sp. 3-13AW TaxID=3050450 RepID=UPI003BB63068
MSRRTVVTSGLVVAAAACAPHVSRNGAGPMTVEAALRVAARPDVIEVGPILHAAAQLGLERVLAAGGGIPNLFAGRVIGAMDGFPGLADAAGQAETQLLRLSVTNPDLRIVMTVVEGVYRIVARRSAGVARVADLAGKRVGVFERTSAAFFLHRMLGQVGLADSDIVRVSLRPSEMAASLVDRQVDAIAIWEPESERAGQALGTDAAIFSDPNLYREFYNLNTTTVVLADPYRRAALVDFVRALASSCRTSVETPAAVWPLVAASSGFEPALVEASWRHHRFPATLGPALLDTMVVEERWLAAQDGRTPRRRGELARLIDRSILAEAGISNSPALRRS